MNPGLDFAAGTILAIARFEPAEQVSPPGIRVQAIERGVHGDEIRAWSTAFDPVEQKREGRVVIAERHIHRSDLVGRRAVVYFAEKLFRFPELPAASPYCGF